MTDRIIHFLSNSNITTSLTSLLRMIDNQQLIKEAVIKISLRFIMKFKEEKFIMKITFSSSFYSLNKNINLELYDKRDGGKAYYESFYNANHIQII